VVNIRLSAMKKTRGLTSDRESIQTSSNKKLEQYNFARKRGPPFFFLFFDSTMPFSASEDYK
jgi:hypothetical protein